MARPKISRDRWMLPRAVRRLFPTLALLTLFTASEASAHYEGRTYAGYEDTPVSPRYDVVYVLDDRGWYYRYSHLHTISASPGRGW